MAVVDVRVSASLAEADWIDDRVLPLSIDPRSPAEAAVYLSEVECDPSPVEEPSAAARELSADPGPVPCEDVASPGFDPIASVVVGEVAVGPLASVDPLAEDWLAEVSWGVSPEVCGSDPGSDVAVLGSTIVPSKMLFVDSCNVEACVPENDSLDLVPAVKPATVAPPDPVVSLCELLGVEAAACPPSFGILPDSVLVATVLLVLASPLGGSSSIVVVARLLPTPELNSPSCVLGMSLSTCECVDADHVEDFSGLFEVLEASLSGVPPL